jgi:hypothetical protein
LCNARRVDHGVVGCPHDPEIVGLAGGSTTLALNVGSRFMLGNTWLGLVLIDGPHSSERGI